MTRALELAAKGAGFVSPNPLVGAVLVKDGKIIGEGFHERYGGPHAEVNALQEAGEAAHGATLYLNLEPCSHFGKTPPCSNALIEAGIRKVYAAMADPNPLVAGKGFEMLRQNGINVEVGMLKKEAERLNEAFIKFISTNRPFVTLKCAITLDGKIATRTGDSKWISCAASRRLAHRLRHENDMITVGLGTVKADNPQLTCRLEGERTRNPQRLVIDPFLETPLESCVLNQESKTWIACRYDADKEKVVALQQKNVELLVFEGERELLPLDWLLEELGRRNIASLLVEGGSAVLTTFIQKGLADKLICFITPKILGSDGLSFFNGQGIVQISECYKLEDVTVKMIENDIVYTAYVHRNH